MIVTFQHKNLRDVNLIMHFEFDVSLYEDRKTIFH